jgi:pyranose oxidase
MRTNHSDTPNHCDVLIVGSGLVGSTFARLLVEQGARVMMLDVGDFHSRLAGENRKNSWLNQRDLIQYGHFVRAQLHPLSAQEVDYPNALASYAVGGMAVHWTCAIPEFHERLERVSYVDDAEWRGLYRQAASLLNRHTDVFNRSARHRVIKRELNARGWVVEDTPMAAERPTDALYVRYSGADTVLGSLAAPDSSDRFAIVAEHCVRRLVYSQGNEHAIDHAEVVDMRTGVVRKIHAGTFIVAAGWYHTAQLLWASGIHTHSESALGRYFSDHTFAASTVILKPELVNAVIALSTGRPDDSPPRPGDHISPLDAPPHLFLPVADDRPWQGMIFRESYQFDSNADVGEDLRGIDLKWFGMIQPVRENFVRFRDDKLDRIGMPTARFHLRLSEHDLAIRGLMMEDMRRVAGILGAYRRGAEPSFAPLGSAIHGTGLTRMGPPEDGGNTSVVDPWSKVWGLDNLYLGGTGVISTATATNPTFTAVALAIRAATSLR